VCFFTVDQKIGITFARADDFRADAAIARDEFAGVDVGLESPG
jgi:hypothetical protein